MKKQKVKLFGVISSLLMLLLVTFSYAWILEFDNPTGHYLDLIFNTNKNNPIKIANSDIEVSLYMSREDDNYVYMANSSSTSANPLCSVSDMAPGSILKYSLKFVNKSSTDSLISISFSGIDCDGPLYNYVYMGLLSTLGFENHTNAVAPVVNEFLIKDKLNPGEPTGTAPNLVYPAVTNAGFKFIEKLVLPANANDIEIRFYIRVDHTATLDIARQNLNIDNITFIAL